MGDWKQRSTNDPPPKRNKPAKKRADFRKKKKDPLGGQPEGGSKSYTQRDDHKSGQQKFWHRVRVATLVLSSLALVAALGAFLIYQLTRRATPLLVLGVDEYAAPLAPNAFAKEDAQRMEDFFGHQSEGKTLIAVNRAGHEEKTFAERLTSSLEDFLNENRPGGPNNDVVMIYLSAHGVVNKKNQACLLPKEADALDDETWLPVSEVLRTIRDKSAALAPGTKILLILDAGRIHTDWSLGILYNGFADRLKSAVTSADIKNLYVLNSTSGGQTAWTDPRHARSIFGYYVAEGLRGGADDVDRGGSGDGLGDGEISLKELHEFVVSHVAGWVKKNRSSDQVPMLIQGADDQGNVDFILAAADSDYREDLSVEENLDEQESEIETLWNDRGKLTEQKVHERDPVNWAKLEHMLLRLERLSLAGDAYRQQFVHTKEDAQRLLDEMKLSVPLHNRPVFSIPLAERSGQLSDEETKHYMSDARSRWNSAQQAKGIEELSADVSISSAGNRPHFVEIQFLEMLAHHIEWMKYEQGAKTELRDDTQEAVLLAVKARNSAEWAAAPADQRAHYWIQHEVDAADATRRRAEDWLYVGSETKIKDAKGALKTLLDETYPQAALRSKQVAEAYDLRDEAWRDAPYLAQRMLAHAYRMLVVPDDEAALSGVDEAEMKNEMRKEMKAVGGLLLEMIGEAHRLGEKLDADRVAAGLPDSKRLGDALTALRERYDPYIDSYSHGRREVGFTTMRDELRSPRFLSDDRSELRSNLRKKYREAIFGQDSLHRLTDPTPADDVEYLRLLVELRVHPALAILDRQWALKTPAADDDKRPLEGKPADRQSLLKQLAEMGGQVRSSLRGVWDETAQTLAQDQVDKNLSKLEELDAAGPRDRSRAIRRPLATADYRLRAAMPMHPWRQTDDHPTALLRSVDLHFQYHWHAQRILEDFWGKSNARASQNFFAAASRGYIDSARRLPGLPWHDEREAAMLKKQIELLGKANFSISGMLDASRKPTDLKKGEPYRLKPSVEFGVQIRESGGKQLDGEAAVSFADQNKEALTVSYGEQIATRIPASLNSETEEFSIKELPASLTAALWYRGHRCEKLIPLASPPLPPRVIAVEHPDRSKTKVTIVSDRPPRVYLAIVLDCSGSMEKSAGLPPVPIDPDAPRKGGDVPKFGDSRFNHVTNRLLRVLDQLPKENCHINLWLFGHRVGLVNNDGRGGPKFKVVRIPGAPGPDKIMPANDVENVLKGFVPAGPAIVDIKAKLIGLKREFHGITPLYLSMGKALEDLEREKIGSQDSRQLLVITDGVDVQINEDGETIAVPFTAEKLATMAAEYFAKDGRIDVYGIDLEDGLEKLTAPIIKKKGSKGHFQVHSHKAKKAILDLERNLRSLIPSPEFRVVRRSNANEVKTGWQPLSKNTFAVKDLGGGQENCQEDRVPQKEALLVEVRGIKHPPKPLPIRLYGGENVKLGLKYDYKIKRYVLKHVSSKSVRRPGKTKQPRPENVTGSLREYYIIRHDPEIVASAPQVNISESRDVIFRFSVRNKLDEDDKDSGKFVPRPRFVLAKITPVLPNPPPGTNTHEYHFYEPVFDSSYSFPCFTFRAKNWPGRSGPGLAAANIELWYVIGDVDSDFTKSVPVKKVDEETPKRLTYFKDLDLTVKLERFGGDNKWKVTEKYGPNAKDHLFKVVLESNPPTDYTKRTYYPEKEKMLVSHEFHYQPSDIPCVLVRKKSDVKKVAGWRKWSDIKIALPR